MDFSASHLPILIGVGFLTGGVGALLGVGGGVILVPILVACFKIPPHWAVGTSLITVVATSSTVGALSGKRDNANYRLGVTLEIATAVGAIGGAWFAGLVSGSTLVSLFAILLLVISAIMWGLPENGGRKNGAITPLKSPYGGWYFPGIDGVSIAYEVNRLGLGVFFSVIAGIVSGLLGVGGGILKVPALNAFCGVPMKVAAATSNFMIGVTALASSFLYFHRGEIHLALTAAITLGVMAGAFAGQALGTRTRGRTLKRAFALFLVLTSVVLFFR